MTAVLIGPGGRVEVDNELGNPLPVAIVSGGTTGGLTDTQLRAAPVPVSFPADESGLTDAQLRASAVAVTAADVVAALASLAVELAQKLEPGQEVALSSATLAALESITVAGTVALDAPTLAALETIAAVVSGTVAVSNFPGSQAVTGPLTDAQLRASAVPVSFAADESGLTDAELRASPVPVSGTITANLGTIGGAATEVTLASLLTELGQKLEAGQAVALDSATLAALETISAVVSGTVAVSNFPATQPVSGPLTDVQMRATPVPVSFPADEVGLTNAELRASAVPISGTVTITDGSGPVTVDGTVAVSGTVPVSGPLTDAQLRASTVPVSGTVTITDGSGPVTVDGTVALDAPTLAALETITVAGSAIVVDANNSTTTPLAAGATYTGTATDISLYQQVNLTLYARPSQIQGDGTTAKGTLFFEFSPDNINWDISVPALVRDPGLVIPIPIINVGRYFRVRYVNDGGALAISIFGLTDTAGTPTLQTSFRLQTQLLPQATKELTRTLDQSISGSDAVTLTRSAATGRNPDNNYVNQALGGTKTLSPTPTVLGASGVYTSGWMDCESFPTVRLLVSSDQISAEGGVRFQWSDTPTGVVVQTFEARSFRSGHTTPGRVLLSGTRARYLRIVYTNGLTPQTRFFLGLRLNPAPLTDLVRIESATQGVTGQQDVTLTATALPAPVAGRRSFRLKNLLGSARAGYYGFSTGLTVLNGDELAVGETVELDIDDTVTVYVITTSVAGAGVRFSYSEIA